MLTAALAFSQYRFRKSQGSVNCLRFGLLDSVVAFAAVSFGRHAFSALSELAADVFQHFTSKEDYACLVAVEDFLNDGAGRLCVCGHDKGNKDKVDFTDAWTRLYLGY